MQFDAEGVALFVQRELLEEVEGTGVLSFDLGLVGRCKIFV